MAEEILQKAKRRKIERGKKYIDTSFIRPTSNMVERFFSKSKRAAMRRDKLEPISFELHLFLNQNNTFWDKTLFNHVVEEISNN